MPPKLLSNGDVMQRSQEVQGKKTAVKPGGVGGTSMHTEPSILMV